MRIIAGKFKSRTIITPVGSATRPTTDRARESLFNVLNNIVSFEGSKVLDLFAGSGALGFEAVSRGAEHVTFVERDRNAIAAIKKNSDALEISDFVDILSADVYTYLVKHAPSRFDIIFADAPYDDAEALDKLPNLIMSREWLSSDGICAIEHRTGDNLVLPDHAKIIRELKAGEASFTIFKHKI